MNLDLKSKINLETGFQLASSYEDIVCNIGDMMQLITDKKLKSTPHRVVKYKTDEMKV